ncbi:tyrosine protein phosphatase yvh1 [Orbilia ellipsospora]|uniref:protein-tyrosine-phosphatase n=1 Tax=Orbilia ellipsospora TaxID=2528407 RepID=A0AAV9XCK6_9PEZI
MSIHPANIKLLELTTGASAAAVLQKLLAVRERNSAMDKIGDTQLYIGGMFVMRRTDELQSKNITHVVSVLRGRLDPKLFEPYTTTGRHLHIQVDDDDDENLIEYFQTSNDFIDKAVQTGGNVFIHCAMGISRSSTIASAYLIYKKQIPPDAALGIIRQTRPIVHPNFGFAQQLQIYYENLDEAIKNLGDVPAYQRYLYRKEVEISRQARKAPTINHYAEDNGDAAGGEVEVKCKMCRRTLANSKYFVEHTPKPTVRATSQSVVGASSSSGSDSPQATCQHIFVDPIAWMRPELQKEQLEGKLECPKCNAKVGSYAWQGMKCSCGSWVTPAISLAKGKVDEVRPRSAL